MKSTSETLNSSIKGLSVPRNCSLLISNTRKAKLKLRVASKVYRSASPKLLISLLLWQDERSLFLSGRTSTILPRGHELRGEFSALTRTTSPMARFLHCQAYHVLSTRVPRNQVITLDNQIGHVIILGKDDLMLRFKGS